MAAVRLGLGLTDLFAVGGFDALTRLRHLGEEVLTGRLLDRLHDTKKLGWAGGPPWPSTRGQVLSLLAA